MAVAPNETTYYQVAATTLDESILRRELAPLRKIPDNHPKLLLTLDEVFGEANYGATLPSERSCAEPVPDGLSPFQLCAASPEMTIEEDYLSTKAEFDRAEEEFRRVQEAFGEASSLIG